MDEHAIAKPKMTARTAAEKAARTDRLAAEMRKNLLKRKRQRREMTSADADKRAGAPAERD